ncbi:hypothetical protein Tco_0425342 [Tanacetum coccineum]
MVAMIRLVVATATVVVAMMVSFGVKGHGGVVDRDGDVVDMEMVSGCGGSSDKGGDDVDVGGGSLVFTAAAGSGGLKPAGAAPEKWGREMGARVMTQK